MPYPYGMYNAPAVGNGLGGLPRRSGTNSKSIVVVDITTVGNGTYTIPAGYNSAILVAIGGGGGGGGGGGPGPGGGGGGGGASATRTIALNGASATISYTVGDSGIEGSTTPGGTTTVTGLGYILTATGGNGTATTAGGTGGTGSGGDFNYTGGTGGTSSTIYYAGGGGAASIDGNGGNGASFNATTPQLGGNGTNSGGGGGGAVGSSAGAGGGPGGVGGMGNQSARGGYPSNNTTFPSNYHGISTSYTATAPPGGGGAGYNANPSRGGTGLVRIQYW